MVWFYGPLLSLAVNEEWFFAPQYFAEPEASGFCDGNFFSQGEKGRVET